MGYTQALACIFISFLLARAQQNTCRAPAHSGALTERRPGLDACPWGPALPCVCSGSVSALYGKGGSRAWMVRRRWHRPLI